MTTPDQPSNDPNATSISRPASPGYGGGTPSGQGYPPVQPTPVRRGPGWGAYVITVLGLIVLIAAIVFVLQNDNPVQVKFFGWDHYFKKSSAALGAAAGAGLIAGLLLGLIPWMSARRKLRNARRGVN
jgi:uncharacterized integral membrane protein